MQDEVFSVYWQVNWDSNRKILFEIHRYWILHLADSLHLLHDYWFPWVLTHEFNLMITVWLFSMSFFYIKLSLMIWKKVKRFVFVPACQLEASIEWRNVDSQYCKRICLHVLCMKNKVFFYFFIILSIITFGIWCPSMLSIRTTLSFSEGFNHVLDVDRIAAPAKQVFNRQICINHVVHVSVTSTMRLKSCKKD